MRKHQHQRSPAGFRRKDQPARRREVHAVDLPHHSSKLLVPRALLDRPQRIQARTRLNPEQAPGVEPETGNSTGRNPPMLGGQRLLAHPETDTRPPGIAQGCQGQTCQGRKIAETGLGQLMQARLPQSVGEGGDCRPPGHIRVGLQDHCSVFVPMQERVKSVPNYPHTQDQESGSGGLSLGPGQTPIAPARRSKSPTSRRRSVSSAGFSTAPTTLANSRACRTASGR